jgi:phage shock protein A
MRLFKRISSTVMASVENIVNEVENHDAVVESMLKELTQATAESKIRLKRIQHNGEKIRQQLQNFNKQEVQWTQRATSLSNTRNEDTKEEALACLERRRLCREQRQALEERLQQHEITEQKIAGQVRTISQRHTEISDKRHLLKSQQSVAEANRVVAAVTGENSENIDQAFDRWELSIAKAELSTPSSFDTYNTLNDDTTDTFNAKWIESERRTELLDELAELQSAPQDTHSQPHTSQSTTSDA